MCCDLTQIAIFRGKEYLFLNSGQYRGKGFALALCRGACAKKVCWRLAVSNSTHKLMVNTLLMYVAE